MKKFLKSQIKTILASSSNRNSATLEKIKKIFPYDNLKDKIELLLNEDKDIIKTKLNQKENKINYTYSLNPEYIKSKKFELLEKKIYSLDYLCSLFKEAEIINIYKIIKDHDKITYQQIVNYLNSIYNLKKDIKQVSHYCLILVKINQILSFQPVTVEKFNKANIVGNAYLKYLAENENYFRKINKGNNKIVNNKSINNNINIFKQLTRSFVVDESEIKNVIMFHLYLNKEKEGITANELYVACDFIRREKILNKIICYMEHDLSISHKVLRKGKIMEFLYHIIDEGKVPSRIPYLVSNFNKILAKYNNGPKNNKNMKYKSKSNIPLIKLEKKQNILNTNKNKIIVLDDESEETQKIENKTNNNSKDNNDNINKNEIINLKDDDNDGEENSSLNKKNISLESEILNEEDYKYILSKMEENKKIIIKEKEDKNAMRKNIINYISCIEKNKNVSLSSYNRYIFILNLLYQKKVLSFVEIKHHISQDLERNKEFVIDRKTIRRLLTTLEKIGLIKIVRYELTMRNLVHKYLNSREEIKQEKIIAVHRDVDINDKMFYNKAIEKLKPNKKIENKKENDNKDIKELLDSKNLDKIIKKVIEKNNDKILINLKTKLFIPIYNVLNKIENKRKINLSKVYHLLIEKLKQNKISNKYITNLYNQKNKDIDIINNYKNNELIKNYYKNCNYNFSSILQEDSSNYSNIIIPKYIMDKYNNKNQNFFIESKNEKEEKIILRELEKPLFSIKSKYYNIENKKNIFKFTKEEEKAKIDKGENKHLIGYKRNRFTNLNDITFPNKEIDKNISLNEILDIICNLPGISIKALRKMLNINSNNFYIEKNIITYMINMGLLYAQDYDEKNLEANDDTKLFPYSDINLFI